MSVIKSTANVGDFTVTVDLTLDNGNVVLSANQAVPYTAVLVNDQPVEVSKPEGSVWAAEGTISYTVTYGGTSGTATEIDAIWQSLISGKDMNFSVAASGDLASNVRFVTSTASLAAKANGEKAQEPNAHIPTTGTGNGTSWTTVETTLAAKVYIALTGTNDDQDSLANKSATLTPSYVNLTNAPSGN